MAVYNFLMHPCAHREIEGMDDVDQLKKTIDILIKRNICVDGELIHADRILQDQNALIRRLTTKLAATMERTDIQGARSFKMTSALLKNSMFDFMKYQKFLRALSESHIFQGTREVRAKFLRDAMDIVADEDVEHALDMTEQIIGKIDEIFEPPSYDMREFILDSEENNGQGSSSTSIREEDTKEDNASNERKDNTLSNSLKKQRKRKLDIDYKSCRTADSKRAKKRKSDLIPLKNLKIILYDFMLEDDNDPYVIKYKQSCTSSKEGENHTVNPATHETAEANAPNNLVAHEKMEVNDTISKVAAEKETNYVAIPLASEKQVSNTKPVDNKNEETIETFNHAGDTKDANDAVNAVVNENEANDTANKLADAKANGNVNSLEDEKETTNDNVISVTVRKEESNVVDEKETNNSFNLIAEREENVPINVVKDDKITNDAVNTAADKKEVHEKEASGPVNIATDTKVTNALIIASDKKEVNDAVNIVADKKEANDAVNLVTDEGVEVIILDEEAVITASDKKEVNDAVNIAADKKVANDAFNLVIDEVAEVIIADEEAVITALDKEEVNDAVNIAADKKEANDAFNLVIDEVAEVIIANEEAEVRVLGEEARVIVTANSVPGENVVPVTGERAEVNDTVNAVVDRNAAASDIDNNEIEIITLD